MYANLNQFLHEYMIDMDRTMYASQAVSLSPHTLGKEKNNSSGLSQATASERVIVGGTDETRTRDLRRDRPAF